MTTIDHQLDSIARPEKIWAVLSKLDAVADYNPAILASRIKGTADHGLGAMRECDLAAKGKVVERVTVWDEGRSLGLEVAESDWPIHFMRWVTHIEPRSNGSRLTQRLEYQVKFGPLGWLLDRIVMRRTIARNVEITLRGLIKMAEEPQ